MTINFPWIRACLGPLGLTLVAMVSAGADTTAPELKALAFTPGTIDTSDSAREIALSFTVADDVSGATHFEAVFTDASGVFRQSASGRFAPTLAGSFTTKIFFPRFSAPGPWMLSQVFLGDAANNTLVLDAEALVSRGFPTRLDVRSAQDVVRPTLTSLEFVPSRIDTSGGSKEVEVSLTAGDDLSGIDHIEIGFVSPSGVGRRTGWLKVAAARTIAGSVPVEFLRQSEAGQWTLDTVFLSDAANNTLALSAKDLSRLGFQTALQVISAQDSDPPILTSLRLSPDTIDTSTAQTKVQVEFRATDNLSGVSSMEVVFESPSRVSKQRGFAEFPLPNDISDSIKVSFPKLSEPGQWTLNSALVMDAAGNTLILDADRLAGMGVRTALHLRSALDTVTPNLTGIDFAPKDIDTRRGPSEVQVILKATDNLSGVKSLEVSFVSPSGSVRNCGSAELPALLDGSAMVRLFFPRFSEPGSWRLETAVLTDAAGNTLVLNADGLAARVGTLLVR